MQSRPTRTLLLTGAPTLSSLQWTEDELCADLQPCYSPVGSSLQSVRLISNDTAPSWRSLPFIQPHLPTGFTPTTQEERQLAFDKNVTSEASFLTATDLADASTDCNGNQSQVSGDSFQDQEEMISQYYEHSFAVHDEIPSSQVINAGSMIERTFSMNPDEYSSNSTAHSIVYSQEQLVRSRLDSGYLSDLKDVPNASHLRSIIPQTMTVNLVVGLISLCQPRTIRTRKHGREVELVEVLVGDETRSGFNINVWLPVLQESNHAASEKTNLRSSTSQLRTQDIILVRNLALNAFRGKVYGQSLRRDLTTIDLLYRNVLDDQDRAGAFRAKDLEEDESVRDAKLAKIQRVKDWVLQFVGTTFGTLIASERLMPSKRFEKLQELPSDTPP